jgi:hypothetical protein
VVIRHDENDIGLRWCHFAEEVEYIPESESVY